GACRALIEPSSGNSGPKSTGHSGKRRSPRSRARRRARSMRLAGEATESSSTVGSRPPPITRVSVARRAGGTVTAGPSAVRGGGESSRGPAVVDRSDWGRVDHSTLRDGRSLHGGRDCPAEHVASGWSFVGAVDWTEAHEHHLIFVRVDDLEEPHLEHGAVERAQLAGEYAQLHGIAEVSHGAVDPAQADRIADVVGDEGGVSRGAPGTGLEVSGSTAARSRRSRRPSTWRARGLRARACGGSAGGSRSGGG